ncbi:MAG: ATP-binding protein, partial [Enterobacterales bacterium]|nr:ATP-binding protein [Enterobacterales bacterium]
AAILQNNGKLLISKTKTKQKVEPFYLDFSEQLKLKQYIEKPYLYSDLETKWLFVAPVYFDDDADDNDTVQPSTLSVESQILGYVILEYSKKNLSEIESSIFSFNLMIGGIIAFLLGLLMNWGINRLIAPLQKLAQTMRSSTEDNQYPLAETEGTLEFSQIADTYNELMLALETQNIELHRHRDTLESEVELRTQELIVARDTALTASRHKSEFLANISHELRTPLQAIIGYNDLVREELEVLKMDNQVDELNTSIRSAHHLLDLINNILDIAKIEAGRMDLFIKPVDVAMLVGEAVETINPIAIANRNKVVIKRELNCGTINIDRQKLMQIFLNLLSNACKFTKDGKIIFEVGCTKDSLYFSISDTGIGIAEEELKRIFEQFTQVDGQQNRNFEGTGLGMAITKSFCELMGGEINVTSDLGLGSCFSVKIPINH